jgi:hypothetical protein
MLKQLYELGFNNRSDIVPASESILYEIVTELVVYALKH